jgi:SOS-response transcriptional repressor LexA
MMGLTPIQTNVVDFMRAYKGEKRVMPTLREVGDHLGVKSLSQVHAIICSLEDRGVVRRMARKARAVEFVEPGNSVALSKETFRLAQGCAALQGISVDALANIILRECLTVAE